MGQRHCLRTSKSDLVELRQPLSIPSVAARYEHRRAISLRRLTCGNEASKLAHAAQFEWSRVIDQVDCIVTMETLPLRAVAYAETHADRQQRVDMVSVLAIFHGPNPIVGQQALAQLHELGMFAERGHRGRFSYQTADQLRLFGEEIGEPLGSTGLVTCPWRCLGLDLRELLRGEEIRQDQTAVSVKNLLELLDRSIDWKLLDVL